MDYKTLIESLTPDIVERLRGAVATGRWPDGRAVSPEQREHSLQAIIAWERDHLPEEQRVGFIDRGRKAASREGRGTGSERLRWVADDGADGEAGAQGE